MSAADRLGRRGRALVVGLPLAWLFILFLVPFLIVLKISFAEIREGSPPFTELLRFAEDHFLQLRLNLGNYFFLVTDDLYGLAYLNAVKTAAISTVLCLLIGYPMAYAIARSGPGARSVLLMLVVMPFWTSFLIRIYALIGILKDNGLVNNVLIALHLTSEPLTILYTPLAMYIGMVYCYLPFMILPLYTTLEKLDGSLLEAAADLGARPARTFLAVTWPLSLRGVIAGSLLVFIPVCGEYVIPTLLGGPDALMIGNVLANEFFVNRDWPLASAVAVVLLLLLVVPIVLFQRVQAAPARDEARA